MYFVRQRCGQTHTILLPMLKYPHMRVGHAHATDYTRAHTMDILLIMISSDNYLKYSAMLSNGQV